MRDAWGVSRTNCTRRSGDDPALIFKTPMNPVRKSAERLGTRLGGILVQGTEDADGCAGIKTQHNLNILTLSAAAGVKHL